MNFYVDKNKEQKIKVQSNNLLRYGSDYLFPNKINNILIYLLNVASNMIYGSYNGAVFIPEFTSVNNVNMSELYNHGNKFNSNYIH